MVNYIVSGLERSGTSLMMQMLEAGGFPVVYDNSRKADDNNPKGYYEIKKGKIINELEKYSLDFNKYDGKCIKITSYGLGYIPNGKYMIIYMERNIDEILDSTQKMIGKKISNRKKLKKSLIKLNKSTLDELTSRTDIEYIVINYNELMEDPDPLIYKIYKFLGEIDIDKAKLAIHKHLYRNRMKKRKEVHKELTSEEKKIINERLRALGYK